MLPDSAVEAADFESNLTIPSSLMRPAPAPDTRAEDKVCRSPIAGVVVSVAASIRQRMRQDDPVLVIEAMKMQTTIGAPVEGVVDAIHVVPGQAVKPGQALCTLV